MEKNTAIVNRNRVMYAANRMQLQIRHFARGVFPRARGEITALPFNRFFLPIPYQAIPFFQLIFQIGYFGNQFIFC